MNERPLSGDAWDVHPGYGNQPVDDTGSSPRHQAADVMTGDSLRQRVVITNPQGLHMRPAAAFAQRAREFQSAVFVCYQDRRVDGKSWLDLLLLAAAEGAELVLEVTGTDAPAALPALAEILSSPSNDDGPPEAPLPPKG